MAQLEKPQSRQTVQGRSAAGAYVLSFLWMILLTGIAFFLVVTEWLPQAWTITVILLLAVWQVVLQLASFMHLRDKGNGMSILFIAMGGVVSATVIVALVLL